MRSEIGIGIAVKSSEWFGSASLTEAVVPVEGVEDGEGAESHRNILWERRLVLASVEDGGFATLRRVTGPIHTIDLDVIDEIADDPLVRVVSDGQLVVVGGVSSRDLGELSKRRIVVQVPTERRLAKGKAFVDDEDRVVGEEEVGHLPGALAHPVIELLECDGVEAARRWTIVFCRIHDVVLVVGHVFKFQVHCAGDVALVHELRRVAALSIDVCGIGLEASIFVADVHQELHVIQSAIRNRTAAADGPAESEGRRIDLQHSIFHSEPTVGGIQASVGDRKELEGTIIVIVVQAAVHAQRFFSEIESFVYLCGFATRTTAESVVVGSCQRHPPN